MIARRARLLLAGLLLAMSLQAQQIETLLLPSESPLVSFRILFKTGPASDAAGKEGLALSQRNEYLASIAADRCGSPATTASVR